MTTLTLGRFNARALARALLLACLVALVGIACGRVAISHYGLSAVEALVVLPILIFLASRPLAACALMLALLASVPFYTALPRVNVPGHPPINIGDVLLVVTVGATWWRRPWRVWPPVVRRVYLAVGAMLVLALIPTVVLAVHGHDAAREAVTGYKDLLYIMVGLTVALELSGRLWWRLVNAATAIAAIVAVFSILAAASGSIGHLLTSFDPYDAVLAAAADTVVGNTARIRLPGLFFVYAMTLPTLVMVLLVKDKWRSLRIVALLLMIGAIAVSLNRNMYFGGAAGLLVVLLLGGARLRHRFLIVAVTLAVILTLVVQSTVLPSVTKEVSARAKSALSSQVLSTNSATARKDEFSHGLASIAQHPWIGVGWFQPYGSLDGEVPRLGVENWYLDLATDMGIPVTAAFLLVCTVLLSYGVRRARTAVDPLDRAMVAACVGALVALLLSCLVGTYLQDPNSMTAFGFTCGLLLAAGMRAAAAGARSRDGAADDHGVTAGAA
jgi:energy-coupling factor transporter transmembrane protein EcfT